jgi:hypothetical protein
MKLDVRVLLYIEMAVGRVRSCSEDLLKKRRSMHMQDQDQGQKS